MLFEFCKCDLTGNWFALTMITSIEHILFYFLLFFRYNQHKKSNFIREEEKKRWYFDGTNHFYFPFFSLLQIASQNKKNWIHRPTKNCVCTCCYLFTNFINSFYRSLFIVFMHLVTLMMTHCLWENISCGTATTTAGSASQQTIYENGRASI